MSTQRLNLAENYLAQSGAPRGQPVSRLLIDSGAVSPRSMVGALAESTRLQTPLPQVLKAEALATPDDILSAQSEHWGAMALRREDSPPDAALTTLLPPEFCLSQGVLPWMRIGGTLVLATARPEGFAATLDLLPGDIGPVMMAITREADIHDEIAQRHGAALAKRAETWVPDAESCRDLGTGTRGGMIAALALALAGVISLAFAPQAFFATALGLALFSLVCAQGLKLVGLIAGLRRPEPIANPRLPDAPPFVSLLVPLFREPEIASSLVARLARQTYPKSRLEALLILESGDTLTRAVLNATRLPPWMRVIEVPPGSVTTKPRALNYALGYARGDIVGVYDAEDAPAPDQVLRIVDAFERAPPSTACLQGILDFYNPRANWLSRCFAIEYASWFRVLLPGLTRLGLAIPLGGTTVFFRRAALAEVKGWDAHNVTEDADLGMRLARHGYRTELIQTVTREEANNRAWPWIKQRSRWLKGYAVTWWVHSRAPRKLWRDLGPRKFIGLQLLFLMTLIQFAMAPVLWSLWLVLLGLPHPFVTGLSPGTFRAIVAVLLSAEAVSLLVGATAIARSPHRRLLIWVPTLVAYFPLGTIALYKAAWEILRRPFYWDKTQHGRSSPDRPGADLDTS